MTREEYVSTMERTSEHYREQAALFPWLSWFGYAADLFASLAARAAVKEEAPE
jgi:hypothetical protein